MMKKLIAGGALVVLAFAGAAWAGMGGHHRGGKFMQQMVSSKIADAEDYVAATAEQRQVIDSAKQEVFKTFESHLQNKQGHAAEMIDLLTADKLDTDKLYKLADDRAAEVREMAKVIIPQIQRVHDVLTPAQRQKLAAKAREMHQRHEDHGAEDGK